MSLASVDRIVEQLREVHLLDPSQLDQVCGPLLSSNPEPRALVNRLVACDWLTKFQAERLLNDDAGSLVIGKYTLLDLLGEGGMGQVFRARERSLDRTVALKVIGKDLVSNPEALLRFEREAKAVARASHPRIVTLYEFNQIGTLCYLAMEYLEGTDLDRLVKKTGPLPVSKACAYVLQAAEGLDAAHRKGLIHRDIKPANLFLLRPDEQIKILDLGLARSVDSHGRTVSGALTCEGAVMGTPDYIAPEQAKNSHSADSRADIYSLGCSLYFLLTGQPPFPDGTFIEKLLMHQMDEPWPLEKHRPEVPPEVAEAVRWMMAKRPEKRPQSAMAVMQLMQPFCGFDQPGLAAGPGAAPGSSRSLMQAALRPAELTGTAHNLPGSGRGTDPDSHSLTPWAIPAQASIPPAPSRPPSGRMTHTPAVTDPDPWSAPSAAAPTEPYVRLSSAPVLEPAKSTSWLLVGLSFLVLGGLTALALFFAITQIRTAESKAGGGAKPPVTEVSGEKSILTGNTLQGWILQTGDDRQPFVPVGGADSAVSLIEKDGQPTVRFSGRKPCRLTSTANYPGFRLSFEYRWGKPVQDISDDDPPSGAVWYYCAYQGANKQHVWGQSVRCRLLPGETGGLECDSTISLKYRGSPKPEPRYLGGTAPLKPLTLSGGLAVRRMPKAVEHPDSWNTLVLAVGDGISEHILNEVTVLRAEDLASARGDLTGKIELRTAGIELFVRNMKVAAGRR